MDGWMEGGRDGDTHTQTTATQTRACPSRAYARASTRVPRARVRGFATRTEEREISRWRRGAEGGNESSGRSADPAAKRRPFRPKQPPPSPRLHWPNRLARAVQVPRRHKPGGFAIPILHNNKILNVSRRADDELCYPQADVLRLTGYFTPHDHMPRVVHASRPRQAHEAGFVVVVAWERQRLDDLLIQPDAQLQPGRRMLAATA